MFDKRVLHISLQLQVGGESDSHQCSVMDCQIALSDTVAKAKKGNALEPDEISSAL